VRLAGVKLCAGRARGQYRRRVFGLRSRPIATSAKATDVTGLSFEAALRELETIVARLEQGEVELEDSIALYERGQGLKAHCEAKLKAAEGRLEKIVLGASGPEGVVPADAA
jgi:exodeoxyribonuclease VII small subunit